MIKIVGLLLGPMCMCLSLHVGVMFWREQKQLVGWKLNCDLCVLLWHVLEMLRESCECFPSAVKSMGDFMLFSLVDFCPATP